MATLTDPIADILKEEGYIWNYEVDTSAKFPELIVKTKFVDGVPALTDLKRISKCGRRKYSGSQEIPRVLNGMGISIISTSRGLMTGHQAKKDKVGGEIIAFVW
jgi:small subunit ribosomal protein S8